MEKMKGIILLFIVAIVGLVFLVTINSQIEKQGTLTTVTDDSFTANNESCVSVTSGCITSLTSVRNTTTTFLSANYSLCGITKVAPYYDGILFNGDAVTDLRVNGNSINATYIESSDCSYNPNATSRNLSSLIVIFIIIAIVVAGFAYFYKDWVMDMVGK